MTVGTVMLRALDRVRVPVPFVPGVRRSPETGVDMTKPAQVGCLVNVVGFRGGLYLKIRCVVGVGAGSFGGGGLVAVTGCQGKKEKKEKGEGSPCRDRWSPHSEVLYILYLAVRTPQSMPRCG